MDRRLAYMELLAIGYGIEWFAIVMVVLAAAAGAVTAVQSGKAQKKTARMQAEYQQSQADAQAKQARNEAEWAEYRIAVNEQQAEVKKRTARQQALETMQRAGLKKGISSDSGSLLDEELRGINELGYTLDLIDWETEIEKTNIRKQQSQYSYQADLATNQGEWSAEIGQFQGEQAETAGYYGAGSSLLAGGAQAANAYNTSEYNKKMLAK